MEGKKRISSSWRFPDSLARFGLPALLSLSQNLTMSRKSSPDVYLMARWTSVHRKGACVKGVGRKKTLVRMTLSLRIYH
jgi:hypothetical protein